MDQYGILDDARLCNVPSLLMIFAQSLYEFIMLGRALNRGFALDQPSGLCEPFGRHDRSTYEAISGSNALVVE